MFSVAAFSVCHSAVSPELSYVCSNMAFMWGVKSTISCPYRVRVRFYKLCAMGVFWSRSPSQGERFCSLAVCPGTLTTVLHIVNSLIVLWVLLQHDLLSCLWKYWWKKKWTQHLSETFLCTDGPLLHLWPLLLWVLCVSDTYKWHHLRFGPPCNDGRYYYVLWKSTINVSLAITKMDNLIQSHIDEGNKTKVIQVSWN